MNPKENLLHDAIGHFGRKLSRGKRAAIWSVSVNSIIGTFLLGCALIALIFQRK